MRLFRAFRDMALKLAGKTVLDSATEEDLEEALIAADVDLETTEKILDNVRASRAHPEGVQQSLKDALIEVLGAGGHALASAPEPPLVILVAGVNGVGKTTTIAKLANRYQSSGQKVLLAAADTFRAAAIDQLEIWADRVGTQLVKHKSGADPAAVVFDAISAARNRSADVVIVDTAGRLHTRSNLMEELRKIARAVEKANGRLPDETLLVLDATTGQNAVAQAQEFLSAIAVTGLVLAKMDGSARGGTVISIGDRLGVPVKLIGTGEKVTDLEDFDPAQFVESLFDESPAATES